MEKTENFLSRRKLLVAMGGTAAAMGVAAAPYRAVITQRARSLARTQPWLREMLSLADAGYDEWQEQVGSVFTVGGGNRLRLAGVRAFNASGRRPASLGRDRAFVAMLDVLGGGSMAGDLIYTASHPQYGPLRIFLSASSDPATPNRMLAVFN